MSSTWNGIWPVEGRVIIAAMRPSQKPIRPLPSARVGEGGGDMGRDRLVFRGIWAWKKERAGPSSLERSPAVLRYRECRTAWWCLLPVPPPPHPRVTSLSRQVRAAAWQNPALPPAQTLPPSSTSFIHLCWFFLKVSRAETPLEFAWC